MFKVEIWSIEQIKQVMNIHSFDLITIASDLGISVFVLKKDFEQANIKPALRQQITLLLKSKLALLPAKFLSSTPEWVFEYIEQVAEAPSKNKPSQGISVEDLTKYYEQNFTPNIESDLQAKNKPKQS